MGHRYAKGARRPDPKAKRDRGSEKTSWTLAPNAIPWPELADGTPWTGELKQVGHLEAPGEVGHLVSLEWAGAWFAIVHWPPAGRLRPEVMARMPLANLVPA